MICANGECGNEFEPKTHNMKYCSDECCREATNAKIKQKYYEKKERLAGKERICTARECKTKLSRYNSESMCSSCLNSNEEKRKQDLLNMVKNVSS